MQNVFGIGSAKLYQPSKPVRNPAYRAFIRRLPCAACGKTRYIDCAHTGPHGVGQKSSDRKGINVEPKQEKRAA